MDRTWKPLPLPDASLAVKVLGAEFDNTAKGSVAHLVAGTVSSIILFAASILGVAGQSTSTRAGVPWLRAAVFLYVVWNIFALTVASWSRGLEDPSEEDKWKLLKRLAAFEALVAIQAFATLVMAQITFGLGLRHAAREGGGSKGRPSSLLSFIFYTLASILNIAVFVVHLLRAADGIDILRRRTWVELSSNHHKALAINFTVALFFCISDLFVFTYTAGTRKPTQRSMYRLLIAAAAVSLVRSIYAVTIAGILNLRKLEETRHSYYKGYGYDEVPSFLKSINVLTPIFLIIVPLLGVAIILVAIRKANKSESCSETTTESGSCRDIETSGR
ncbi:hypothetical protein HJFPF1_12412 [Paramyrothecium foliicola]|nr:hypothetical protein HJFPF1_12412 [Paramyrothecium foliicola]